MSQNTKAVVVLDAANAVEVELARELLVKAGIPCAVRGHLGSIYGGVGSPRAVEVMPKHAARARAVLAEAWGTKANELDSPRAE